MKLENNKKRIHILNPMKATLFCGSVRIDTSMTEHNLNDDTIRYLEQIGFKIRVLDDHENK